MAEAIASKLCTVCGVDCSGRPRVKDQQGRYMCQECFDRAKATKHVQKAPPPAPAAVAPVAAKAPAVNMNDNSFLLDLGTKSVGTGKSQSCPECGRALTEGTVICIGCGHNMKTGKRLPVKVERAKKVKEDKGGGGGGGFDLAAAGGGTIFLIVLALYGAITAGAVLQPDLAGVCLGACALVAFGISIWVLIEAFKESVVWGLGSLFVPAVALVYLIFFCEDGRVKGAYFGMVLGYVAFGVMIATGQIEISPA
jgi:hypothetical protein